MIGCWPAQLLERGGVGREARSSSSSAGVRPSLSKRTSRSCGVELTLNSSPASSHDLARRARSHSATSSVVERRELGDGRRRRRRPPCGPARRRAGTSMSSFSAAQALGVERARAAARPAGRRPSAPRAGDVERRRRPSPSRSSWPSAAASPSGSSSVGVADEQLVEQVAGLGGSSRYAASVGVDGQACGTSTPTVEQRRASAPWRRARPAAAAVGDQRAERRRHVGVVEHGAGEPRDLGRLAVGDRRPGPSSGDRPSAARPAAGDGRAGSVAARRAPRAAPARRPARRAR